MPDTSVTAAPPVPPRRVPMDAGLLSRDLGARRAVVAFSAVSGARLGHVTMTLPACARPGGPDGAFVRSRRVKALLPLAGLRFSIEGGTR